MTITQLKYILAVSEYKNFTKAAKKTFVTQPTLSMQIQKLEEELGVLIFNRNKKPIELTPIGSKIIFQAKNIVNEAYRMQDIVAQERGFIGGEFKLGIIPTVMPTLLPIFLKTFISRYPKVQLKIEELSTDEIIKKLNEGHLDAAIAATPLHNKNIKERPIYYEPFVGYIPERHRLFNKSKIKNSDLNVNDILLLEDGHCFRNHIVNLCNSTKPSKESLFTIESGSFETLIKLANEGMGMTLLPLLHIQDIPDSQKKHIKHFESPSPAREISILHNVSELKMQLINALHEVVSGLIKVVIKFQDVDIISPIKN